MKADDNDGLGAERLQGATENFGRTLLPTRLERPRSSSPGNVLTYARHLQAGAFLQPREPQLELPAGGARAPPTFFERSRMPADAGKALERLSAQQGQDSLSQAFFPPKAMARGAAWQAGAPRRSGQGVDTDRANMERWRMVISARPRAMAQLLVKPAGFHD